MHPAQPGIPDKMLRPNNGCSRCHEPGQFTYLPGSLLRKSEETATRCGLVGITTFHQPISAHDLIAFLELHPCPGPLYNYPSRLTNRPHHMT